ncbi:MAG: hypothetical protein RL143_1304 [Pseudomonadota bacterium]
MMQTRLPDLATPDVRLTQLGEGAFTLESKQVLKAYQRCVGEWLEYWVQHKPDHVFLGEKHGDEWRKLTYGETRYRVGRIAQGLLDLGLNSEKPVVVLSENSIDHALISLAAMHVGIPVATVSSAYSTMDESCERLNGIIGALEPGLVFAENGMRYGNALNKIQFDGLCLVSTDAQDANVSLLSSIETDESAEVANAFANITPDTHARYLLTSGSTGTPKVVINTHRMLCANQQQMAQVWPFVEKTELLVVDWLPWSHTFGANHNFNLILRNGGTMYIDDGRPMPGAIEKTIANIKELRPNLIFNVPRGFEVLVSYMERDEELREAFFKDLILVFYAGAALPMATWNRMREMAFDVRGDLPFFTSSWGSTETAPAITNIHFEMDKTANLGSPLPGLSIKFVPSGDKLELRVKGPSIFPGYRNNPEKTADAFDEEGYYKIEDAGKLIDESHPEKGIAFNGRVTEDFKLTTGTWVSVGTLRTNLVSSFTPYAQDFVICGHNQDEVGALMFPTPALKELAGDDAESLPPHRWLEIASVRDELEKRMRIFKEEFPGSSQHIRVLRLLDTPPNMAAGEITDKGYLNQRTSLNSRADQVSELYETNAASVLRI